MRIGVYEHRRLLSHMNLQESINRKPAKWLGNCDYEGNPLHSDTLIHGNFICKRRAMGSYTELRGSRRAARKTKYSKMPPENRKIVAKQHVGVLVCKLPGKLLLHIDFKYISHAETEGRAKGWQLH